jgi:hypothetical protein
MISLKINEEKFKNINSNLWLKCPSCLERFRPPATDLYWQTADEPQVKVKNNRLGGPFESKVTYPEKAPPAMTLPPCRTVRLLIPTITGLVLLVAALVLTTVLVFPKSLAPLALNAKPAVPKNAALYQDFRLASDLAALRKSIAHYPKFDRNIDYPGPVWRVYGHFSSELAPGACQKFASVRVWSYKTNLGFKARANCLDQGLPAEIEVKWNTNQALVTANGQNFPRTVVELDSHWS